MRAFLVAWRALVSFYNEMFLMITLSLLWWVVGGIFVGLAVLVGLPMLQMEGFGLIWLVPLLAIPAGPACAAMAHAGRQAARELHVDRGYFWEGLRLYWKQALALNAISMVILALLMLNILFYLTRSNAWLFAFALLWTTLLVLWLGVQIYLFPVLVGLKTPTVLGALKTSTGAAFANPLFSIILLILAGVLTGLSVVFAVLVVVAWPAVISLMGEQGLRLIVERAGGGEAASDADH